MSRLVIRAFLAAGVAAAVSSTASRAAAQAAPECRRCLDGHRFLAASFVPDPFVATYFSSAAGGGLGLNVNIPVHNLDGQQVGNLHGDIGFLLLDFRYQYAIWRWLGVRASAVASGRVGTSTEAILASGASASYGGALGLTVQVWRSGSLMFALTGDYGANTDYLIDPFKFAQGVAQGGLNDSTRALLLRDEKLAYGLGGARGAWAPTRWIGVNAVYDIGAADTIDDGWNTVSDYGAVVDVDFRALSRVPIGVAVGGRGQTGSRGVIGPASSWSLGVHYTGRPNFTIGVEGTWAHQDLPTQDVPNVTVNQARLITRLDF